MLKGYKTYIVAALAVLGALAGWLDGDLTLLQALQTILPALLGASIRAGVSHQGEMTRDHIERLTTEALNGAQLGQGK